MTAQAFDDLKVVMTQATKVVITDGLGCRYRVTVIWIDQSITHIDSDSLENAISALLTGRNDA